MRLEALGRRELGERNNQDMGGALAALRDSGTTAADGRARLLLAACEMLYNAETRPVWRG